MRFVGDTVAVVVAETKYQATDAAEAVAVDYGVRAIPTMILFKGGQAAETLVGMMPKAAIKAKVAAHL